MNMDLLQRLFGHICGQVNLWVLDGGVLPMCQRCTGLYVGGIYAIIVIAIFRLKPNGLLLWAHGAAMLLMIPFGYHLLSQGAVVRTITGQLFAYGLAYFLFLNLADRWDWWCEWTARDAVSYVVALAIGIVLLWIALVHGGYTEAWIISFLGTAGALTCAVLVSVNVVLFARIGVERLHKRRSV